MRIILLEKINNLGDMGQEVNVKAGYARNFLIPAAKAVLATKKNIEHFQANRLSLENNLMRVRAKADYCISEIKKIGSVTIFSKSGVAGKLFGSIGVREIADAVVASGINISKYNVRLPNGRIRYLGDYNVIIQIHNEAHTTLNVRVVDSKKNK